VPDTGAGQVAYFELNGRLDFGDRGRVAGDAVVLSKIEQGGAFSPPATGLCIRYVGRGREDYRIRGRGYRLDAAQVMISPQDSGAEIEIRRRDRAGTFGLCVLLRGADDGLPWPCGPLVVSADCTVIGQHMERAAQRLSSASSCNASAAAQLVSALRREVPIMTRRVISQAAALEAAKPATRYEMVRSASLAQAYLHGMVERAVGLQELARAVGKSPSRLLRAFQHCFGETPAAYHRRLRLQRVFAEAQKRNVSVSVIAGDFGFAGSSSLSHVYRRAFGRSWRSHSVKDEWK
jgi:AraC-like DNA-binding protein